MHATVTVGMNNTVPTTYRPKSTTLLTAVASAISLYISAGMSSRQYSSLDYQYDMTMA